MTPNTNILFCSAGRRGKLLRNFRESLPVQSRIIATDNQAIAPALYFADAQYLMPRIDAPGYIDLVLDICRHEQVGAVTTLIDPEIELLAANRQRFLEAGVLPLCPSRETAHLCFDKYALFRHLIDNGIRTVLTYDTLEAFCRGLDAEEITFPVFIKPRTGSGSVGIHKVANMQELQAYFDEGAHNYIIQEFMDCEDCDADVYIDTISHRPVAIFSKHKLETRIGGANKTISFKDQRLFQFVEEICQVLEFNGPVDMDFWCRDGEYYLSEVNPRFGGAYLHAYGAGVNFVPLIVNNMKGGENLPNIGNYDEGVIMMMYDDVVIINERDLATTRLG
ncbi:MAG: ATP-grasp domain-containing protein [Muribaculaceae bacterium]|nr:ATP-grasp domain-containing protein [Muribaculaceae bacterium]